VPTVDALSALPGLADVPREQLQWLLDHGEVHRAHDGAILRGLDGDLQGLFLLISGRFSVRVEQGGTEREVREVTPGSVTGYLPYSKMATPRGYLVADGPVEFLSIRLDDMREMTRACYEFTAVCVQEMLERVRVFKSDDKRQERMAALGRLAAGLAHELNNPAAAAARAGRELVDAQFEVIAASRELGTVGLEGEALRALESLEAASRGTPGESLSAIAVSELEDRLMEWLEDRSIDADLAYPLAESGIEVADLESAAPLLDAGRLGIVLRYIGATCAVRGMTADIAAATERIHSLVATVKKHTHMDRASEAEPLRLEQHLRDTVTLMSAKAALKAVTLELSVEADLPAVEGFVADLNQVWMHLVDNAIDAVAESGRITIDAERIQDSVVLRVIDDGPGIPQERQEQVFEPFFSTKDVGEGRGLGLDIVRTVVRNHRGTVQLTSVPGRTEFRVTLPASEGERPGLGPTTSAFPRAR
jgi:signal transduction histidine kinase